MRSQNNGCTSLSKNAHCTDETLWSCDYHCELQVRIALSQFCCSCQGGMSVYKVIEFGFVKSIIQCNKVNIINDKVIKKGLWVRERIKYLAKYSFHCTLPSIRLGVYRDHPICMSVHLTTLCSDCNCSLLPSIGIILREIDVDLSMDRDKGHNS